MTKSLKKIFKKGDDIFHKETKEKFIFAKWLDDGTASIFSKDMTFHTVSADDLSTYYQSYRQIEKDAKENRKGQGW